MAGQIQTTEYQLTPAQADYVSYTACGGLLPSDEGAGTKLTAEQFAHHWGVARQTLYEWRKQIPDFWDRVAAARTEIGGKDKLSAVWNTVYLKAVGGSAEMAKLYLANFDKTFKMPANKVEVEAGQSWAELLERNNPEPAEDERDTSTIIEGEVVVDHPLSLAEQIIKAREMADAANNTHADS